MGLGASPNYIYRRLTNCYDDDIILSADRVVPRYQIITCAVPARLCDRDIMRDSGKMRCVGWYPHEKQEREREREREAGREGDQRLSSLAGIVVRDNSPRCAR